MTEMFPDKKLVHFDRLNYFFLKGQNDRAYHLGPELFPIRPVVIDKVGWTKEPQKNG